jgi:hypothetical protein
VGNLSRRWLRLKRHLRSYAGPVVSRRTDTVVAPLNAPSASAIRSVTASRASQRTQETS